jgi:hypothetical protein
MFVGSFEQQVGEEFLVFLFIPGEPKAQERCCNSFLISCKPKEVVVILCKVTKMQINGYPHFYTL